MDEILFGRIIRYICLAAGIIGTLAGLDLIFGAKVILALKRILDTSTDVVDKALTNPRTERIAGVIILILSLIILFLAGKTRI